MCGFKAGTCEGNLVLFKTCQSVEGPKSKYFSMSPASCLTRGNNSKLHGVVFELILIYSFPIEILVKHYLAKQKFEMTEFTRWLPHPSWTAIKNFFLQRALKFEILSTTLYITNELFSSKVAITRNELLFCGFYRCVNSLWALLSL